MAMGRIQVGWTENPIRKKNVSGEKLHPDPHPRVKFQTRARTRRVSAVGRVC
jgi:hypothetical protein